MKKLLLILMLLIPSMALADITKQLTTAGADCSVPTNCVTHNIATYSGATVTLSGTFIATVRFEASSDGTVWSAITGYPVTTGAGVTLATTPGNWQFSVGGLKFLRVRCSAITTPPTVNIVGSMGSYTPPASVGAITVGAVDQGTGGASAWLVDGTGGTFPITSAGTLNVAGTGTAGTPGTAVLTVQGIGSGTAVPVSGTFTNTALSTAQAADIAGVTGPLVQASTLTTGSNPAYTTAKVNPLSISTIGGLRAEGVGAAGTAAGGVMSIQGVGGGTAVPISGTVTATVTGATATVSQGLSTAYDSTLTGLGNSVAALTATTTVVQMLYCNNSDTSAHTVTVTNTAGGNYVGPSFSIPALSNVVFWESQVGLKMVGVKWGADTANKVYCQISGLQ